MNSYIHKSVSVVIPTYNGVLLLKQFLHSVVNALQKSSTIDQYEIIIVDDASQDSTQEYIRSLNHPSISYIHNDTNCGFSQTINRGIEAAQMELTLLLNNDMEVAANFFDIVIPYFANKDVFGINCEIRDSQGEKILEAAKRPTTKHGEIRYEDFTPKQPLVYTLYLCGGNALVDTEKLKKLGGFNELFSPFYFEDFDLSLRAWRKGWKCLYTGQTFFKHCHSATIQKLPRKDVEILFLRNRMLLNFLHKTSFHKTLYLIKLRCKQHISNETTRCAIKAFFDLKKEKDISCNNLYNLLISTDGIVKFLQKHITDVR